MSDSSAYERAAMPTGTAVLLDERSVEKSNANLIELLRVGQQVLDVGCGSGSITAGICNYVGNQGLVVGIDRSEELIGLAREKYSGIANLQFICGDVLTFVPEGNFDIITSARTLQWVAHPENMIAKMTSMVKPGGFLTILDYNHSLIQWDPLPPESMRHFYHQFLKWRSDAGMDNEIGDHLAGILGANGLQSVTLSDRSEYTVNGQSDFVDKISIWTLVANTRGKQMVADNYISESERAQAAADYGSWCRSSALSMKLILRSATGRKTGV